VEAVQIIIFLVEEEEEIEMQTKACKEMVHMI